MFICVYCRFDVQVVLMSVDYQSVAMCVMAFLVYMCPLEYVYTVIPLLPTSMPLADAVSQVTHNNQMSST